jgi:hypothetical protein
MMNHWKRSLIRINHFPWKLFPSLKWRYREILSIKIKNIVEFLVCSPFSMFSKLFFLRLPWLFSHLLVWPRFEWSLVIVVSGKYPSFSCEFQDLLESSSSAQTFPINKWVLLPLLFLLLLLILVLSPSLGGERWF